VRYSNTSYHDNKLNVASAIPASKVRASPMLILLTVGN